MNHMNLLVSSPLERMVNLCYSLENNTFEMSYMHFSFILTTKQKPSNKKNTNDVQFEVGTTNGVPLHHFSHKQKERRKEGHTMVL